MSTPANRKRALERAICRQELSEHLKKELSIVIPASEVRLHPIASDPYRWQHNENYGHLFERNLSDLSTNNYIQIREALQDGNIWAVKEIDCREQTHLGSQESALYGKFREDLDKLRKEKSHLQTENEQLRKLLRFHTRKSKFLHLSLSKAETQTRSAVHIINELKKLSENQCYE